MGIHFSQILGILKISVSPQIFKDAHNLDICLICLFYRMLNRSLAICVSIIFIYFIILLFYSFIIYLRFIHTGNLGPFYPNCFNYLSTYSLFTFKNVHVLFIRISAAIDNTCVFPFMNCGNLESWLIFYWLFLGGGKRIPKWKEGSLFRLGLSFGKTGGD